MLKVTPKRRENLAKVRLNTYTVVLTGLVVPFALRAQEFRASIFIGGSIAALVLIFLIYLLER